MFFIDSKFTIGKIVIFYQHDLTFLVADDFQTRILVQLYDFSLVVNNHIYSL